MTFSEFGWLNGIGKFPKEWKIMKIKELGNVITGSTPPTKNKEFYGGEFLFITAKDFKGSRYIKNTEKSLSKKGAEYLKDRKIPPLSIMVTCIGSDMGKVALTKIGISFTNQQINTIIPNKVMVNPIFLYYRLYSLRNWIKSLGTGRGSAKPILPKSAFEDIEIPIPSLSEQCKIAETLGSLDDKIELNYEMNKTLEAIAQAIFKNWFVDFEPFKDELVYNEELGRQIPRGWCIVSLRDICEVNMGQSPPSDTYNKKGDGLPFFQGIRDFGFRYPKPSIYCNAPRKIAEPDDILFSVRAPIGELNMALVKSCIGRGIAALRYKFHSNNFLFYFLKHVQKYWKRTYEGGGTVFGDVTKENLETFELLFPGKEIVERFNSIVGPIDHMIKINEQESHILTQIRDALLPKLLSGEIRVRVDAKSEFLEETKRLEKIREEKIKVQETLERWLE